MKSLITKFSQWMTAILLGALGFSACSESRPEWDIPLMYGSPTVDYQTEGRVTDSENNPIPGLKVVLTEKPRNYSNIDNIVTQTLTTDADGKFTSEITRGTDGYSGTLTITDIDQEENGGYFSEETISLDDVESSTKILKEGADIATTFHVNVSLERQEPDGE